MPSAMPVPPEVPELPEVPEIPAAQPPVGVAAEMSAELSKRMASFDADSVAGKIRDAVFPGDPGPGTDGSDATALPPANKSENSLGILMHVLPTLGLFWHVPFLNIVPPLALWLYMRGESRYLDEHGKEVLNFQLGVGLVMLVAFCFSTPVVIAATILAIIGAIKASEAKLYRYPLTFRLLK
jgi:uncharacterized protein